MGVRIDEPGHDGFPSQVDLAGARRGKSEDIGIGANGKKAAAGDGDSFRVRVSFVNSMDVAVVQDEAGRRSFRSRGNGRTQTAEERAPGRHGFHSTINL